MEYVLRGTRMVFSDRRLRGYWIRPFLWTFLIYFAISFTISTLALIPLRSLLESAGMSQTWSPWVGRLLFLIVWSFVGGPIFFGLNGLLSSLLWEKLSLKVEEITYGSAPNHRTSLSVAWGDTFRRLPLTIFVTVLSFCLGLFGAGWVSIWPVGWLCLYDFTAAPYARRGLYYPQQKATAKKTKKAFSYAMTVGVLSLFPIINLFALPGCIAGATMLVRESEG